MTNRRSYIMLLLAVALLCGAVHSCKDKDDDDTVYEVFDGALSFDIPAFVAPGEVYVLTPKGVRRNSSDELTTAPGYYWSISPTATGKDTTRYENSAETVSGSKYFTVPDTLCTLTISCVAFAQGYQVSSATVYTTVVKPTELNPFAYDNISSLGSITDWQPKWNNWDNDWRESRYYPSSLFGSQWWTCINMLYKGTGRPYADCAAMSDIFGRYYSWEEAQTACPGGWHLATRADWASLAQALCPEGYADEDSAFKGLAGKLMVDARFNGEKMWPHSADVRITNFKYFGAIPAGYAYKNGDGYEFAGAFKYAAFWVREKADATHGQYRYFHYDSPDVYLGIADKSSFLATVRCVRD